MLQLLVELIPELEIIIGKQPPVPLLSSHESRNRFHAVFRKFLSVFARREHPLALFLDDLQWQDPASLKLLEHLITHPEVQYRLLIGAYRDNEVNSSHPLMVTLDAITKAGASVHNLVLTPLSLDDMGALLADTLLYDPKRAVPLARLVQEKTGGNPFFTIQFLGTLFKEGLIEFDTKGRAWRWEVERIRAKNYTDNVVELMVEMLSRLPAKTLGVLMQVSCLGNTTEIATLAKVHRGSEEEVHADLWEAMLAGLVPRIGGNYKFLHDRVHEAAYSLIPNESSAGEHLRIGRLLLVNKTEKEIEEDVFTLVNQFNRGIGLVTEVGEKDRIRRMNVLAGRKAKAATAYISARDYLASAMALLAADAWRANYEDTYGPTLDLSECEYLAGNFQRAEELFNLILGNARSNPDLAQVYRLQSQLYQVA